MSTLAIISSNARALALSVNRVNMAASEAILSRPFNSVFVKGTRWHELGKSLCPILGLSRRQFNSEKKSRAPHSPLSRPTLFFRQAFEGFSKLLIHSRCYLVAGHPGSQGDETTYL